MLPLLPHLLHPSPRRVRTFYVWSLEFTPHPLWYVALSRGTLVMTAVLPKVTDVMSQQTSVTAEVRLTVTRAC